MSGGKQGIARVDRLCDAPERPDGRSVSPRGTLILDVVMNQGEIVDELDGRGDWRRGHRVATRGTRGEKRDGWPDALASINGWGIDRTQVGVREAQVKASHSGQQWCGPFQRGDCLEHGRFDDGVD